MTSGTTCSKFSMMTETRDIYLAAVSCGKYATSHSRLRCHFLSGTFLKSIHSDTKRRQKFLLFWIGEALLRQAFRGGNP